ncbi:MAG TPA: glycosyltransferase family 4 protein, partial [Dehalococcoidia bacterium]|nr:glycosyltransferase family 4 protein [Dehalococcoidia bacterium]
MVLFITRKFPPSKGGMQRAAFELSRHLSQITQVKLIKWGGSNKWLPFVLPWFFFRGMWSLLTEKIQVIYLQDGVLAPLGVIFKLFTRKPVVITLHGRDITYSNRLYQFVILRCLQRMDRIVCVSQAILEACCNRGIIAEKTAVIANGISDEFYVGTEKPELRAELADFIKTDLGEKKILLTVGRFVAKKGIDWFVEEVMPQLADDTRVYVIAGSGVLEPDIRKSIEKHNLQNDVFLVGMADDDMLRLLYNAADIFVMPNMPEKDHMEGFGLVSLEAASCGLPVVAAGPEDIKNAIQDGKNGFVIEPGNPQEFINRINELLGDEEKRRSFGE